MPDPQEPILTVEGLTKWFPVREGLLSFLGRRETRQIQAVDGVSFTLGQRESVALVGESGSGKTTTVKTILRLTDPTAGRVIFAGQDLVKLPPAQLKQVRRHLQLIYQDPYEALNPRMTVEQIVTEPLLANGIGTAAERRERAVAALLETGLRPPEDFLERFPHELSGGQRQRVAIAAALVLRPTVIMADEPVSMLDASRRVEIIQLLQRLQAEHGLSYLIITHDLSIARYLCDRILVMYLGEVVETAPTETLLAQAAHPYTRALLSVVPDLGAPPDRPRILVQGETPNPANIPSGCRFHPRCPWRQPICAAEIPPVITVADGHTARCHFAGELPELTPTGRSEPLGTGA